jgi:hypothetical protein
VREYKYSKRCPYCGQWIVLALSDDQRFLPNVYREVDGFKRSEGHAFDLKATVSLLETEEEVNELIEELTYHKNCRLTRKKRGDSS